MMLITIIFYIYSMDILCILNRAAVWCWWLNEWLDASQNVQVKDTVVYVLKCCTDVLLWCEVVIQWDPRPIVLADGSMWLRPLSPTWHNQTADVMVWSSFPRSLPVVRLSASLVPLSLQLSEVFFCFHYHSLVPETWSASRHIEQSFLCSLWLIWLCYLLYLKWGELMNVCLCSTFACEVTGSQPCLGLS